MSNIVYQILYLIAVSVLNIFMFGIAKFYKNKLDSKAFSTGFLIAIIAIMVSIVLMFFAIEWFDNIISVALAIAGVSSLWNSTSIYYSMKQIHR